jgi:immune inhibitor A
MIRRLTLLLATCALAACALPFAPQPTPLPPAPTATLPGAATTEPAPTGESSTATTAPEPAGTAEPTSATQPTGSPALTEEVDDPAAIAAAVPDERDQVALAEAFKSVRDIPTVARTEPLDVKLGDVETFWVMNVLDNTNYQVKAELRYMGPIVLMYVDTSVHVDQADIEKSAKEFEEHIYQRDRELFGHELSPGIDGDPRLTILNTPVQGAGGYFSSADTVVKAVNRFSNEREMFVINLESYPVGSQGYGSTLAHEFQHMIEWNEARRSPSWFNEGMSTIAEDANGYVEDNSTYIHLFNPDIQLTGWSDTASQNGEHYGTSRLFLRYFQEQYAGEEGLSELIKADAGNNLEAFVPIAQRKRSDIKSFADIFADWAVANVVNDPSVGDGRYTYKLLPSTAAISPIRSGEVITTVHQFGTDYLGILQGPQKFQFDGEETVALTGARPKDGRMMWWSNRGDDSASTMTRAFDLSDVRKATLQFSTWYEIEQDFDYGYVAVSTDDGKNWTTLKGDTTTDTDPQGQNLGDGFTGVSGAPGAKPDKGTRGKWIDEQMDLSRYAGKRILLRFMVVSDAALNYDGMLIDNIRIPELNYNDGAEEGDAGWQTQGFVRTTGELAQEWALRYIQAQGGKIVVEAVPVDDQGRATIEVPDGARGVLAVMGTTKYTTEPATYTYNAPKP